MGALDHPQGQRRIHVVRVTGEPVLKRHRQFAHGVGRELAAPGRAAVAQVHRGGRLLHHVGPERQRLPGLRAVLARLLGPRVQHGLEGLHKRPVTVLLLPVSFARGPFLGKGIRMSNLIDYKLADVGEGIAEAEVIEWLVAVGDTVKEDQPVVVVETDKSQIEIPAPVTGIVKSLGAKVGDVLAVGSNLMQIEATGVISKDIAAHASAPTVEVKQTSKSAATPARATNVRPLASPSTRKLADSLGVDLDAIVGSGPNGRITSDDVTNAKSGANTTVPTHDNSPTIAQTDGNGITLIQLRGLRRQIATSMSEALRIPHITEFKEIDATALMALRSELVPQFEKEGIKFSVTPLLMRACVIALQNHPTFNARFDS